MSDESEDDAEVAASLPFSWAGVAYEIFVCGARMAHAASLMLGEVANSFACVHNKFIDDVAKRNDGEKFARDVLSGLNDL